MVVLWAGLGAREAAAKDMNGRFGIGGAQTLGGVRGFDVMYWAGPLAINGTIGFQFGSPSMGDSTTALSLAGGVLFAVLTSDRADLSIGGRINVGTRSKEDTQFTLEAPLRIEWYASDHLSFHGEVGVAVELIGDSGSVLDGAGPSFGSGGGTAFVIGGTFVTAGGGFDIYF
jgi:hypothetical protein